MLSLLTSRQIRDADEYTINAKGISSITLMETAAMAYCKVFMSIYPETSAAVSILCGTGNNGGDGLAIARILSQAGYEKIRVSIVGDRHQGSRDFTQNLQRLGETSVNVAEARIEHAALSDIVIDAIFGTGLNRPITGETGRLIEQINGLQKPTVAVDIPSGLPAEGPVFTGGSVVQATTTITFERPKINFYFPESAPYCGNIEIVPIGLDAGYIDSIKSPWKLQTGEITDVVKERPAFAHKGTFGHALIVAGSTEKMGAAALCADACLHAGAGLTTLCTPAESFATINSRSPEIMLMTRPETFARGEINHFNVIAFGPGVGLDAKIESLLRSTLIEKHRPMVLDADALTIISRNPELLSHIPFNSVLTPHMKEFDRLFGHHESWWHRLETARERARELQVVIVLKNRYTFVVSPEEEVFINPTGNPAMASGGAGDVLTGIIAGLLAQSHSPLEAAMLGCYLHGLTADELAESGMYAIPARYLVERLPQVMGSIVRSRN